MPGPTQEEKDKRLGILHPIDTLRDTLNGKAGELRDQAKQAYDGGHYGEALGKVAAANIAEALATEKTVSVGYGSGGAAKVGDLYAVHSQGIAKERDRSGGPDHSADISSPESEAMAAAFRARI